MIVFVIYWDDGNFVTIFIIVETSGSSGPS